METLWLIYEYFICLCETSLTCMLFMKQLGSKDRLKVLAILLVPVIASSVFAMNRFNWPWAVVASVNFAAFVLYAFLIFKGTVTRKMLWAFVPSLVFAFSDHLIVSLLMIVSSRGVESIVPMTAVRAIAMAMYIGVSALIMIVLSRLKTSSGVLPLFHRIFPIIITLIGIAVIMVHEAQYDLMSSKDIDILPCAITNIVISLLCGGAAFVLHYSSALYRNKLDAEKNLQLARLESENVEQIRAMHDYVKGWRHDMRGLLSTIETLADNGEYDSMKQCLKEFDAAVRSTDYTLSTGNPAIDAAISEKLMQANRCGITVSRVLAIPADLNVNAIDTCSIIMNLLGNAIEATSKLTEEKKHINFSMQLRGLMLEIKVKNPSNGEYLFDSGRLMTTKPDKAIHGLGLKRVKCIAEKHGGYVQIEPKPDSFEVTVLFGLEDQQ